GGAGRKPLLRRVRRTLRRADRQLAAAKDASDKDAALHEARKDYKKARYAVETVRPLAGKPAKRLVQALTRLQDVLGGHQDAIVTAQLLSDLAGEAGQAGENTDTYAVLRQRQQEAGEHILRELPKARRKATRGKVRRWLTR